MCSNTADSGCSGPLRSLPRCSLFVVAFFGASKGQQRFVFKWSDGNYFFHLFLAFGYFECDVNVNVMFECEFECDVN